MKVRDLIRIKRPLTVQDDYSGECNCIFEGWIKLTPKAEEKFKKTLDMSWRWNGSEIAVVSCQSNKEVERVREFFECIDGDLLTEDEWNALFIEPEERSWEND